MPEPIVPVSFGMSQETYALSRSLGERLRQRRLTLACAESCTGGLLSAQIVAVPGSSDYFLGGVVAYANAVKAGVLGVREATLAEHGAVSWQTAVQMAAGARGLLGARLALATTGIAGPSGSAPDKPVGLVYIALAAPGRVWWEQHRWTGSRAENNAQTMLAALTLLARYLECNLGETGDNETRDSIVLPDTGAPIVVEFSAGTAWPTAFRWRGQRYGVEGYGRNWEDEWGNRHILAMNQTHGVFELCHDPQLDRWFLLRGGEKAVLA